MTVSVCTIARGRDTHLRNLILGLTRQSALPHELIIAYMQTEPYANLPKVPFPIEQVHVPGERYPLAAARNAAAAKASGEALIFLDVDCIPLSDLVVSYSDAARPDRCLMGDTRYLAQTDQPESIAFDELWKSAVQHPARRFGSKPVRIPETTEFWSLSFAMTAATFWKTGGLDTIFEGYGGEDTDFAVQLGQCGVDLHWVPDARAVHQWHRVQIPAYNHLEDIIRNANLFYQKHGQWCMDYWLGQFEKAGLIRKSDSLVEIVRHPSADERQAAICDGSVRFS